MSLVFCSFLLLLMLLLLLICLVAMSVFLFFNLGLLPHGSTLGLLDIFVLRFFVGGV